MDQTAAVAAPIWMREFDWIPDRLRALVRARIQAFHQTAGIALGEFDLALRTVHLCAECLHFDVANWGTTHPFGQVRATEFLGKTSASTVLLEIYLPEHRQAAFVAQFGPQPAS